MKMRGKQATGGLQRRPTPSDGAAPSIPAPWAIARLAVYGTSAVLVFHALAFVAGAAIGRVLP